MSDPSEAPYPLILTDKDSNEKEYLASALTDKDLSALTKWVQSRVVAIARNSLREQLESEDPDDSISQGQYDEEMGIAYTAALGVSIYSPKGIAVFNTPEGVARIGWQMLRKEQPNISYEDLVGYCRKIENQTEIFAVHRKLNGMSEDTGGTEKNEQGST